MSTTLTTTPPATDWTPATSWPPPPAHAPQALPKPFFAREDRTVLLAMHAMVTFGLIISVPLISAPADVQVFLGLGVAAFIALPGILLAAFRIPGSAWWAAAGPLVAATYFWLPSISSGSLYADAHLVSIVALLVFAPLFQVVAPMTLLGQRRASAWTLVLCGLGVIAAPAVVYASLAYPLAV